MRYYLLTDYRSKVQFLINPAHIIKIELDHENDLARLALTNDQFFTTSYSELNEEINF